MDRRQRAALLLVLMLGALARVDAMRRPPGPDAWGYLYNARVMTWSHPWGPGPREPLWTLLVKLLTAPFGYTIDAMQGLSCLIGVLALGASAWALRAMGCRGWVVVLGTAAVASSERLIDTSGQGTRESTAALAAALAVGLAARAPHLVPLLAAVMTAVRWEMGLALFAVSLLLVVIRTVDLRWLTASLGVAAVLMGPFLADNADEFGDPMFHSNVHATFYMNLERTHGVVLTEPPLPPEERIHPDISTPMYRGPLISWGDFVLDVLGPTEVLRRVTKASVVLPVDALRLGWLPWPVAAVLFGWAIFGAVRQRDRAVLVAVGLIGAAVVGYGMLLPWFDRRLVSHLAVLLVILICAPLSRKRRSLPSGTDHRIGHQAPPSSAEG